MPVAFLQNIRSAKGVNINNAERNLLSYVNYIEKSVNDDVSNDFNFSTAALNVYRDIASERVKGSS